MPFSDDVKGQTFARSGGRCECTRLHTGVTNVIHQRVRCPNTFQQGDIGEKWDVRHRMSEMAGGSSNLDNSEALCMTCYQLP